MTIEKYSCAPGALDKDAHRSIIFNRGKRKSSKCVGEEFNKIWYIDTMEYLIVVPKNEVKLHALIMETSLRY